MSGTDNKAIVRRFYDEVLNQRRVALLDDLAVVDYVEHDPFPGQGNGREEFKARVGLLLGAFDPLQFTIEDIVAEGDRVAVRWRNSGAHSGNFMGMPATGAHFSIAGVDFHRLRDGRLAEHWHVVDMLSQLQQIGVLPSPQAVPS